MGIMKVMSPEDGDKHISWDPNDSKSVEKAKKKFDKLIEKGHKAFKVKREPSRSGTEIKEFDPQVGEVIVTAPMAGG